MNGFTEREMFLMEHAFKAGMNSGWANMEAYLGSTLVPAPGEAPTTRGNLLLRKMDRDPMRYGFHIAGKNSITSADRERDEMLAKAIGHLVGIDRALQTMIERSRAVLGDDYRGGDATGGRSL